MEKKRVSYYDLAKGFGIIIVVLGHIEYISAELRGWISSFHMPLFFVVSGMLIAMKNEKEVQMGELLKKKLRGIMLPYFWFSLIYFPIDIFNIIRGNIDRNTFIWDQIYSVNCLGISVMWFLPALFVGEVSALLLIKNIRIKNRNKDDDNIILSNVILILTALVTSVALYQVHLPVKNLSEAHEHVYAAFAGVLFVIIRGIVLSVFIVFGYVFQNVLNCIENKRQTGKNAKTDVYALTAGIALFILNIFMSVYNECVDTHYLILKNLPMFYLCACIGSMGVILICKGIGSIKFIEYFGRNSLIIMATHIQFFILYISLLVAFKIDQYTTFAKHPIFIFCTTAFVMVLEIPVIEVINRCFPFILGKKFSLRRNKQS